MAVPSVARGVPYPLLSQRGESFPKEIVDAFGGVRVIDSLQQCEKCPRRCLDLLESYAIRDTAYRLLKTTETLPDKPVIQRGIDEAGALFIAIFFSGPSVLLFSPSNPFWQRNYNEWHVSRLSTDGYVTRRVDEKDINILKEIIEAIRESQDPTLICKKIIAF